MLAASAYFLDKNEGLFSAQPPCLTRFYCTYQTPLDLSDDELFSGQEAFEAAVKRLGPDGWDRRGSIHTITWQRARCSLSPFSEEILEMTLGVQSQLSWPHVE